MILEHSNSTDESIDKAVKTIAISIEKWKNKIGRMVAKSS
jgi:hypothetical protein